MAAFLRGTMPNNDRVMDQLVEQLHACLAEAVRQSRPEPFVSPVTVAEIYQDLVPYRTVRSRLGFEMNADYEHTLLRLLAGEGEYARLEPKEAREELRAELATPNPNVGLFRKFAGCDVWIATPREGARLEPYFAPPAFAPPAAKAPAAKPPATKAVAAGRMTEDTLPTLPEWQRQPPAPAAAPSAWAQPPAVQPAWDDTGDAPELLLEEEVIDETEVVDAVLYEVPAETAPFEKPVAPSQVEAEATPPEQPVASAAIDSSNGRMAMPKASGQCAFCDSTLPGGRAIKFCPYCGMDQTLQPCASCSEALAPDWRYCIACGAPSGVPVAAG
jgi:hypothetical protein